MTNKFALVFPGQGSQSLGMLNDFANEKIFQDTFKEASDILGYDLWNLIQNDSEKINITSYTQPALLASSVAIYRLWESLVKIKPLCMAGHSLGEYSALVCANSIKFSDALTLVKLRGELMQSCPSGAMAAVLGLSDEDVKKLCDKVRASTNKIIDAANYNSPGQVVVAGDKDAILELEKVAKDDGAKKVIILKVSVASHCGLMKDAAEKLAESLKKVKIDTPSIPVIHNYSAKPGVKEDIVYLLTKQLTSPVKWVDSINYLASNYCIDSIFECGPGKILSGLIKRINSQVDSFSLGNKDSFNELVSKVS